MAIVGGVAMAMAIVAIGSEIIKVTLGWERSQFWTRAALKDRLVIVGRDG